MNPKIERHPPSQNEEELLFSRPLSTYFPICFRNKASWSRLDGHCRQCDKLLPMELLRGVVHRNAPRTAQVEAIGYCHECNLLTRFSYRLHDDMRITGMVDGKWASWQGKPTLFSQLKQLLKKLFL